MSDSRWSIEKINAWYQELPWLVDCNFIPSTAINQLEMWQADTFDIQTTQRELGWAEDAGLNAVRVFLHDLAWQQDPKVQKAHRQVPGCGQEEAYPDHAGLLHDCWNSNRQAGKQPEPKPYIHNSGWLQSPGIKVVKDRKQWGRLEAYHRHPDDFWQG